MRWTTVMLTLAALITSCSRGDEGPRYLKAGTGSQVGVYYAAGLAIADLVNEGTEQHGVDLAIEATDGSVFNINALLQGELELGFAQADRVFQAYEGWGPWLGKSQDKLRRICSLHTESITLVAAEDSGIRDLRDIRSHTVSLGSAGSGTRGNALECLQVVGLVPERDFNAEDLKASEASMMLQDGRIDAFFYTVGHPNGSITEATSGKRRVRFVPIEGMDILLERAPYYSDTMIPMDLYPMAKNRRDVKTIGMRTVLVTRSDVPDEVVYQVTRALFENLDAFKTRHPSFKRLKPRSMIRQGQAPIHPGAERYFKEKGWI